MTQDTKNDNNLQQKDIEKIKHLQEASKPIWITEAFVEKPCKVILINVAVFVICTILTIAFNLFEQTVDDQRLWYVWDDPNVIADDTWQETKEFFKKETESNTVSERSEPVEEWNTFIMLECYDDQCDNVLTEELVNYLYKVETKIKSHKDYKSFCLATPGSTDCADDAIISITDLFNQQELSDQKISESELNAKLNLVLNDEDTYQAYSYLFGKEFKASNKKTILLRSIFKFGAPITYGNKTYKSRYDNFDEQEEKFIDFSQEMIDITEEIEDESDGKVTILIFSQPVSDLLFEEVVNTDFLWALASILFVWAYLTFHLKSFFLSSFSMLAIIMSFNITSVLFELVFQVKYFSTLHILVIFIVLGIAADDVFVFIDAWKQTEFYDILEGNLNKRMAVTFRRASKAMLATSSTTSAAFLATGFSNIMPISSFGIYAGILVPVNYLLVIFFFPAVLIFHEKKLKGKGCCGQKKEKSEQQQQNQDNNKQQQQPQQQQNEKNNDIALNQEEVNIEQNESKKQENQKEKEGKSITKIEIFFENQFNNFVYKGRFPIVVIFAIWFGISVWRALEMGPQTKPDQWLPESYKLQRSINHVTQNFIQSGESDSAIKVNILWGLKGLDQEKTTKWDGDYVGELIWDKDFDLSPQANQQYFYDFCMSLKSNKIVIDGAVDCFMLDFKEYVLQNNGNNPNSFPVDQSQFYQTLLDFTQDPLGISYYLANQIGIFKGKLHYVAIESTSIGNPQDSYLNLQPIEEDWQKVVDNFKKNAPTGLKQGVSKSSFVFSWMISQEAFVDQAINGMLISLTFAFVVLVLSTFNIVISLVSILSITGIVTSVVTIMELSGWQLGIAESITIVILIGFSVDYVVHLANHYVESSHNDRYSRMQESLKEIGISIISGAITTLGSGIFLFFAVVSLFNKFAVLIVSTICFSLVFSLIFFSAMMHILGPQGNFGNLLVLCKKKQNLKIEHSNSDAKNQESQKDLENQK